MDANNQYYRCAAALSQMFYLLQTNIHDSLQLIVSVRAA